MALSEARMTTWSGALEHGVSERAWRHPHLQHPFHGVAVAATGELNLRERIQAYTLRMPQTHFFSHATAAVLHGLPLPRALETATTLHISASVGGGIPRGRGVIGHHAAWDRTPYILNGRRLSKPVDTWCELWRELHLNELVSAGDYLVTGDEPYSGNPPLTALDDLRASVRRYGSRRGAKKLRAAVSLVRYGSMSPQETQARLLLVGGGLPEPQLNTPVFDERGTLIALLDLAFVEYKVAIEYQSKWHDGPTKYRNDMVRRERLEDLGWTVIFVSADDLRLRPHETIGRVRARLRARGARV